MKSKLIKIEEIYKDYEPSVNVFQIVERLMNGIPTKYLVGLQSIVLTNSNKLNRKRKRQKTIHKKRRVLQKECRGLYHQAWNDQPAYIEIFVDNIMSSKMPDLYLKIPPIIKSILRSIKRTMFLRDFALSKILYHEIGHHIHTTQIPEFKEREDVADIWCEKLRCHYFYRKYWYIFPIAWVFLAIDRKVMEMTTGIKFK